MAFTKRIICLANSFKIGGSCIAGREILPDGSVGGWIRPVSDRSTEEISWSESLCIDNTQPKLLDIVEISFVAHAPHGHQTENYRVNPGRRWVKVGRYSFDSLSPLAEKPVGIWINSDRTYNGAFNCISEAEAGGLRNSLLLLKRTSVTVNVGTSTWGGVTKKAYYTTFVYKGIEYTFKLTDPLATNSARFNEVGDYTLEDAYLCLSLAEPWDRDGNRCHKLVASIITNPPLS